MFPFVIRRLYGVLNLSFRDFWFMFGVDLKFLLKPKSLLNFNVFKNIQIQLRLVTDCQFIIIIIARKHSFYDHVNITSSGVNI